MDPPLYVESALLYPVACGRRSEPLSNVPEYMQFSFAQPVAWGLVR